MSVRETKKRKTKQAILEAAISLFSVNGYENTSIEQIAKVAGVGKGTVYSYFNTKKEIIKGFCEYEIEKIHIKLVERTNQDTPVLEQMLIIYMTEFNHVTQNKEFGRLYMRESVFPNDSNAQDNLKIDNKFFQILYPILEKGQERGELRKDVELLYITAHFYSLYIMIISAWYTGRITTEEVEPAMELLFRQVLEGLQPTQISHTNSEIHNE
jgi:AcrR family transcriptional regulator